MKLAATGSRFQSFFCILILFPYNFQFIFQIFKYKIKYYLCTHFSNPIWTLGHLFLWPNKTVFSFKGIFLKKRVLYDEYSFNFPFDKHRYWPETASFNSEICHKKLLVFTLISSKHTTGWLRQQYLLLNVLRLQERYYGKKSQVIC